MASFMCNSVTGCEPLTTRFSSCGKGPAFSLPVYSVRVRIAMFANLTTDLRLDRYSVAGGFLLRNFLVPEAVVVSGPAC
jgi:hypothetical protein